MRKIFYLFACIFYFLIVNSTMAQNVLWGMTSDGGSKNGGGNIFSVNPDGTSFQERYAFLADGQTPYSQQLFDNGDGYLYGITGFGGTGKGILYKVMPDGSNYQVLYNFQQATGYYPYSGVMKGLDGYLYGTTSSGGSGGYGVVYRISVNGTGYQVLHNFTGADGSSPACTLTQYSITGDLYGTTTGGGANSKGTVFKIKPDGTGFQLMHSFSGVDGWSPSGGLIFVSIGRTVFLYGVTNLGGNNNIGTIYRIVTDGTFYSVQYNFSPSTGSGPNGPLLKIGISGGILYGATRLGGTNGTGTVYAFNFATNAYQVLHHFPTDGRGVYEQMPTGPLINVNGVLYGTTEAGGILHDGSMFKINTDGTGYQAIYNFTDKNGFGNLLLYNGQVYGLTVGGQVPSGESDGTIYRINPDGTGFQFLHSFNNPNGFGPSGSLTLAQDGNLYGLTTYGGSGYSNGIIFSIKKDGTAFTPLQWLGNGPADGNAMGSLIQSTNGNFYGMNYNGSLSFTGNIFKFITGPPVNYQAFSTFCLAPGCASHPMGSLLQASDGILYGMASASGSPTTYGAILKMNTDGSGYSIIHTLGASDGHYPTGSLIEGTDGYLYGMTPDGGTDDFGTIFKVSKNGALFTTLFNFGINSGYFLNGTHPGGSLLLATDGKLYGMAYGGGSSLSGTIFRINTNGTGFQVIFNFNGTNGLFPLGSLVQDKVTGILYGTTEMGGVSNFGTVFKINTDGSGFQKLADFTGINGKYPKGDLLLVSTGAMMTSAGGHTAQVVTETSYPNESLLSMYPNPSRNIFNISLQVPETGKVGLTLLDPMGRIVKQSVSEKSGGIITQQWDLSHLPAGVYLLKAQTPQRQLTRTIIKQ